MGWEEETLRIMIKSGLDNSKEETLEEIKELLSEMKIILFAIACCGCTLVFMRFFDRVMSLMEKIH